MLKHKNTTMKITINYITVNLLENFAKADTPNRTLIIEPESTD